MIDENELKKLAYKISQYREFRQKYFIWVSIIGVLLTPIIINRIKKDFFKTISALDKIYLNEWLIRFIEHLLVMILYFSLFIFGAILYLYIKSAYDYWKIKKDYPNIESMELPKVSTKEKLNLFECKVCGKEPTISVSKEFYCSRKCLLKNDVKLIPITLLGIGLIFFVVELIEGRKFQIYEYSFETNLYTFLIILSMLLLFRQTFEIKDIKTNEKYEKEKFQEDYSIKMVNFEEAVELLYSERYKRNEIMNIEFECIVQEEASAEKVIGSAIRTIKVTDTTGTIFRRLFVWGDSEHRHNIDLVGTLKKWDKIKVIEPRRPEEMPLYKDELGKEMLIVERWNKSILDKGSKIIKIEDSTRNAQKSTE